MIVCECLGLTDQDLKKSLKEGASKLSDIVPVCALKESCGSCFSLLREVLKRHQQSAPDFSASRRAEDFSSVAA